MSNIFEITTGISVFPSDNELDSMSRRDRISVKKTIAEEVFLETYSWLRRNKVKATKNEPFFRSQVEAVLTVYYSDKKRRDVHNLSIKHAMDQIVKQHIIADDDYLRIPRASFVFGGLERKPRAVFRLLPIEGVA